MKAQNTYLVEVTDTFGGEANYCWVKRYAIRASTERGAIWKLSRYTGYSWRDSYGGRYDAKGTNVCAFVEFATELEVKHDRDYYNRLDL